MNRNKAKLMTISGIVGCLISTILLIYSLAVKIIFLLFVAGVVFVVGVVLVVVSLAYYTEK